MKSQSLLVLALTLTAGAARADSLPHAEMRTIAVNALVSTVHLDESTAERVQSVIDRYRDSMLAARIDSTTTMQELKLVLRTDKPDERRVKKLSDSLLAHRAQIHKLQTERLHDLSKVLTPAQFGRLLAEWRNVERTIRKEARRS